MGSNYGAIHLNQLSLIVLSVLFLAITACTEKNNEPGVAESVTMSASEAPSANQQNRGSPNAVPAKEQLVNYVETGDLRAIKKQGTIRFVNLTGASENLLPRDGVVSLRHFELANKLAKQLKLEPKWIKAQTPDDAVQMIIDGEADVIAYNLTVTDAREALIDFTVPLRHSRLVLVTGPEGPDISNPSKLENIEFIIPSGSSIKETAEQLVAENPNANLTILEVDIHGNRDTLMDAISGKSNRVAILEDFAAEDLLNYRDDLRVGAEVSEVQNIAWGVRKTSKRLHTTVDNFLTRNLVKAQEERITDWKGIKKSGVIRLLTYNGPTTYFLWKGVLMGFDYDLAQAFANKHKLQLQVIVVPYEEDLADWLRAGRGDFAGAELNITTAREAQGMVFTKPYVESSDQVVSGKGRPPINQIQDLNGRKLTLRAYSSFIETAKTLKNAGIDVDIRVAPPDISQSQIFSLITDGLIDATIAHSGRAKIEASVQPDLVTGALIGDPRPQGWMVLQQNWHLLKNLNKFLQNYRKTGQYQKQYQAYFEPNKRFMQRVSSRVIPGENLSPYDELVQESAFKYDFDWRMIVAQMWQESNFNPKAESPVGAQGLMQVMPATAEEMGFPPPLFEPERSIKAGVKYMDWVRDRFNPALPTVNRLWFTLASYNAGYGHLLDAQRLAEQLGLDPNVWFDNVEVAMLKLAQPQYFKRARYGYVRGSEPVQYVRNISNLYKAYVEMMSDDVTLRPPLRPIPAKTYCAPGDVPEGFNQRAPRYSSP
ncbi:transporter substrate-binding domain-containing protein [Microbulbifer sp. OS29]|uniref:Transporter substrate-binding domain-containing protein n=1 Tax=Microbulbifer okhotskensis TaxID=2926617 RepID=A0A9X2J643_9GAMM|nr:transporter substrate-binding domain-containing protein [Microbulbifer okhotskensis]MCO1335039.1 transporter substrate-binding domain-containing protein [Microbulbifer okhotskensis]